VRCPGHTIQFLGYGYSKYVEKTLKILGLTIDYQEWTKYENWTPHINFLTVKAVGYTMAFRHPE